MIRVKVVYEGQTGDADEMEFKTITEIAGSYRIEDGALIDLNHVVQSIYRLCDKKKEDGSPLYLVTGVATLNTKHPESQPNETVRSES